jgi:hypothetical protein
VPSGIKNFHKDQPFLAKNCLASITAGDTMDEDRNENIHEYFDKVVVSCDGETGRLKEKECFEKFDLDRWGKKRTKRFYS